MENEDEEEFKNEREKFIRETKVGDNYKITSFPQIGYTKNVFFSHLGMVFGSLFIIAYIYPSSWLIRGIVAEKEKRIREGMFMMGLNESSLLWAWLTTYFVIFTIIAAIITLIVYIYNIYIED